MYLKQTKNNKGRIYLSFVHGYRDHEGKSRSKTVEKIGYLDEFLHIYDDPIAHFKKIAKEKTNEEVTELTIKNIHSKTINYDVSSQKNLGYVILKKMFQELQLDLLLKEKQKKIKASFNINSIMQLLVYSRILFPGSKKETFENKETFFENFNFSLKDLYRSLDVFSNIKNDIEKELWFNTKDKYNRDVSTTYYDCTNYYFEISNNDEDLIDENGNILEKGYRKKGYSKENRKSPIIQMGLLMDNTGCPLSYDIFPGNESEKTSLRPAIKEGKAKFNLDRVVVVSDRALNTSDNTVFIAGKNNNYTETDGYIFGQTVRGADKEFKRWVLNKNGYIKDDITDKEGNSIKFIHKSRVFAKTTKIDRNGKRNNKFDIYQKQMVYYSKKYADKQKRERNILINKAKDLISNPGKYTKATAYGAAAYINDINFDKNTGEIINNSVLSLNNAKIKEEEKYDGYYAIVTSELEMSDKEIRDKYKNLWEIEETFKITKSSLKTRPVYVWTKEHIEAHFLVCFIALVLLRLLEKDLKEQYSSEKIINSLKKYTSTKVEHDVYLQSFRDKIISKLENIYNVDLSKKYLTLSKIRQILK